MALWEDFEDGTSRLNTLSGTSSWSVDTGTPAYVGTYGYVYSGGANHSRRWDNSVSYSASDYFVYEGYVRAQAGGTNLVGLVFGQSTIFTGYSVIIDTRNSTGGSSAFQIRKDNSTTPLAATTGPTISSATWYKIRVEWRTSGTRITAKLYDTSDTLLATITSNDTSYTSGYCGLHCYNTSYIDELYLIFEAENTIYNDTHEASITAGESFSQNAILNDTHSESITAGESFLAGLTYSDTLTESIVTGDSLSTQVVFSNSLNFSATLDSTFLDTLGGGNIKVYDGADFVPGALKIWNGSSWDIKPVKYWDGDSWELL